MPIKHNYLTVAATQPTAAVTAQHEIVINEVDGSLWSKNSADAVIQVGGSEVDLSAYTPTTTIDADNATQDTAIAGKAPIADGTSVTHVLNGDVLTITF